MRMSATSIGRKRLRSANCRSNASVERSMAPIKFARFLPDRIICVFALGKGAHFTRQRNAVWPKTFRHRDSNPGRSGEGRVS